jgi:hypothetical protein
LYYQIRLEIEMESLPATPSKLRQRAMHYREMVRGISDPRIIDALKSLADEYEAAADRMETESGSEPP